MNFSNFNDRVCILMFQIGFRVWLGSAENQTVRRDAYIRHAVHGHGHERVSVHTVSHGGRRGEDLGLPSVRVRSVSQRRLHRQVKVLGRRVQRHSPPVVRVHYPNEDRLAEMQTCKTRRERITHPLVFTM